VAQSSQFDRSQQFLNGLDLSPIHALERGTQLMGDTGDQGAQAGQTVGVVKRGLEFEYQVHVAYHGY
jgi:hypothetical protein